MPVAELVPIVLNVSIALIVLSLGLSASLGDAAYLFRHPRLLLRSLLSMSVAMPIFTAVLVSLFPLHPAVKIAIIALALSPVPPFLPVSQMKAGGNAPYVISLLVITSLLAIVLVPLGATILEGLLRMHGSIPILKIAGMLALTVTLPVIVGMVFHQLAPGIALKLVRPAMLLGYALMVLALVPVLFSQWTQLWSMVGEGTLAILTIFAVVGVTVGHFLGGPNPEDQVVLALATATHHPGVALIVALANYPDQTGVFAVILWHLVVSAVITAPYVKWMHLMPHAHDHRSHSPPIR